MSETRAGHWGLAHDGSSNSRNTGSRAGRTRHSRVSRIAGRRCGRPRRHYSALPDQGLERMVDVRREGPLDVLGLSAREKRVRVLDSAESLLEEVRHGMARTPARTGPGRRGDRSRIGRPADSPVESTESGAGESPLLPRTDLFGGGRTSRRCSIDRSVLVAGGEERPESHSSLDGLSWHWPWWPCF